MKNQFFFPHQIEEQKKKINVMSQQPTCNPVFKRFLTRLLKDIQRLGLVGGHFIVKKRKTKCRSHKCINLYKKTGLDLFFCFSSPVTPQKFFMMLKSKCPDKPWQRSRHCWRGKKTGELELWTMLSVRYWLTLNRTTTRPGGGALKTPLVLSLTHYWKWALPLLKKKQKQLIRVFNSL